MQGHLPSPSLASPRGLLQPCLCAALAAHRAVSPQPPPIPLLTLSKVGVSLPQVQGGSNSLPYHQPYQQGTAGLGGLPSVSPLPAARHAPGAEGLALKPHPLVQEQKLGGLNRPGNEQALTGEAEDLHSYPLKLNCSCGSALTQPRSAFIPSSVKGSQNGMGGCWEVGREAGTLPAPKSWYSH